MSDPMQTAEIEDVLASIRRLVSEEPAAKPPVSTAATDGKLVLTPAFRVKDPVEPDGEGVGEAESENIGALAQDAEPGALNTESAGAEGSDDPSNDDLSAELRAATLEQKVAELEAAVARSGGDWEPDGSEPEVEILQAFETARPHDETSTHEQPDGAEVAGAADTDKDFAQEDDYLDEDSLRELVIAIVREELKGALGERITRNVRKLVRHEVNRLLASQKLD